MSKRNYSQTHGAVGDIQRLSHEELEQLYNIEIDEDGSVFDQTLNSSFETLEEWAQHIDDQEDDENYGTFTKIGGRQPYDDE